MHTIQQRAHSVFVHVSGGVLLAGALNGFLIALDDGQILSVLEPIFGMPMRYAVVIAACIESIVAMICLFGHVRQHQFLLLAWLASVHLMLWAGLALMNCSIEGSCLGGLTNPLRLTSAIMQNLGKAMWLLLLLGGLTGLLLEWGAKKKSKYMRNKTVTMPM